MRHVSAPLALVAFAAVGSAQPRLVFPVTPEHNAGALSGLRSIDVATSAEGRTRIGLFAAGGGGGGRIYAGEPGAIGLFREVPFRSNVPGLGQVNHYLGRVSILPDGRAGATPSEVYVLGLFSPTDYTPLIWGLGPVPGERATVEWGLSNPQTILVSDAGEYTSQVRVVGNIGGISGPIVIVRASEAPGRSRVLFVSGTDPQHRLGYTYRMLGAPPLLSANASGLTVVNADLYVNNTFRSSAFIAADDSGPRVLIDAETPLPAPFTGGAFDRTFAPGFVNAAGDFVFTGNVRIGSGSMFGLFRWRRGELEALLAAATPMPRYGPGVVAQLFDMAPTGVLTPQGDVVATFRLNGGGVTGANDFLLAMVRASGEIVPIYREGDPLPEILGPAAAITRLQTFDDYMYVNKQGHFIFRAVAGTRSALFSWSRASGLRVLLATGQTVDFAGQPREARSLPSPNELLYGNYWVNSSNGEDCRLSLLDENGTAYIPVGFGGDAWGLYAVDVPDPCPLDTNGDDFVDLFDYKLFVRWFEEGDPGADYNADGMIDHFDYMDYVAAFEQGC